MNIKELEEKILKARSDAEDIVLKAGEEGRDSLTDVETQKFNGLLDECERLNGDLKKLADKSRRNDALRDALKKIDVDFAANRGQGSPQSRGGDLRPKTLGEQFVESVGYKSWLQSIAPSGSIPETMRGIHSPLIEFKGQKLRDLLERKDLITGANPLSAGAFVNTDHTGLVEPLGRRPLTLRDLGIVFRPTTSDAVDFVQQTVQVTESATVPEANVKVYSGATGEVEGVKPQGKMYWEKVTETVKTIAVWVAATRRALSDVVQLRQIIDGELRDDIDEKFEDQILTGNGVGDNFRGLQIQPGTLIQGFGATQLATCRTAVTSLLTVGRARPTGWLMNPVDWEAIETAQDLVNGYYGGGPFGSAPARLWGYPVVQNSGWPQGTCWLADWRKMLVFDRESTQIYVTDSHEDFFVRNIIAILAEMRAAMGLLRPSAFINVFLA